jgi:hypothetical protein
VTLFQERDNWFVDRALEEGSCHLRGISRFFAVTDTVNGGNENSVLATVQQMVISGLVLAQKSEPGNTVFDHRRFYCLHFFTATVVP